MSFHIDRNTGHKIQVRFERTDRSGRWSPIHEPEEPKFFAAFVAGFVTSAFAVIVVAMLLERM